MDDITTVLAAAASYDLTDLPTVKDELSIKTGDTSKDAILKRAITQVSSTIANDTNRVFAPELLQDLFDLRRHRHYSRVVDRVRLQLARWPIIAVTSVIQTTSPGVTLALVQDTDFRLDTGVGQLVRLDADTGYEKSWERLPVTVQYTAGYGDLQQENHTVPASGSHQVTVTEAASFSCDQAVNYGSGALLARVAANPAAGQYSVAAGVYSFNASDGGQALAFAYVTLDVPADLVAAALQLVTAREKSRGRDPTLVQRDTPNVGVERFWFGSAPGQTGVFTPDIQAMLDKNYRVPVLA